MQATAQPLPLVINKSDRNAGEANWTLSDEENVSC